MLSYNHIHILSCTVVDSHKISVRKDIFSCMFCSVYKDTCPLKAQTPTSLWEGHYICKEAGLSEKRIVLKCSPSTRGWQTAMTLTSNWSKECSTSQNPREKLLNSLYFLLTDFHHLCCPISATFSFLWYGCSYFFWDYVCVTLLWWKILKLV